MTDKDPDKRFCEQLKSFLKNLREAPGWCFTVPAWGILISTDIGYTHGVEITIACIAFAAGSIYELYISRH